MKKHLVEILGAALMLAFCLLMVPAAVDVAVQYLPHDLAQWLEPAPLVLAPLTSLTHVKRLARQTSNLAGFVKLIVVSEEDVNTTSGDWPKRADVTTTGESAVAITMATGKTFARVQFDINSAKGGSKRIGELGYQAYIHEFECEIAGYAKDQNLALDATFNMGALLIGVRSNGDRVVFGSALSPMVLIDEVSFGAKGEDQAKTVLKFSSTRALDFRPVLLATATTITETAFP